MAEKKANFDGLNILLGVSGGIAAYKAVELARRMSLAGAAIKTVMTTNACRFVQPMSFEAVTHSVVFTSLWRSPEDYNISHISLVEWADMVVVAPATANIIGKVANGICDEILSTILCVCWDKPTLLAPAMNEKMWTNPAVQNNVKAIRDIGFELIGPEEGSLACGTKGLGRMSEPTDILEAAERIRSNIEK